MQYYTASTPIPPYIAYARLEQMRIYDRVLERCTPVQVDGEPIRHKMKGENRDFARKHLT